MQERKIGAAAAVALLCCWLPAQQVGGLTKYPPENDIDPVKLKNPVVPNFEQRLPLLLAIEWICNTADCVEVGPGPGEPGFDPQAEEERAKKALCKALYMEAWEDLSASFPAPFVMADAAALNATAYTAPNYRTANGDEIREPGGGNIVAIADDVIAPDGSIWGMHPSSTTYPDLTAKLAGVLLHEFLHTMQPSIYEGGIPFTHPNIQAQFGKDTNYHYFVKRKEAIFALNKFLWFGASSLDLFKFFMDEMTADAAKFKVRAGVLGFPVSSHF